eukprot:gene909-170_t
MVKLSKPNTVDQPQVQPPPNQPVVPYGQYGKVSGVYQVPYGNVGPVLPPNQPVVPQFDVRQYRPPPGLEHVVPPFVPISPTVVENVIRQEPVQSVSVRAMVKLYEDWQVKCLADGRCSVEVPGQYQTIILNYYSGSALPPLVPADVSYHTVFDAKRTLFFILRQRDDVDALKLSIESGWVSVTDVIHPHWDMTPLQVAAFFGHLHCVRYLLGRGDCPVNYYSSDSKPALTRAMIFNRAEVVESLASDHRVDFSVAHAGNYALSRGDRYRRENLVKALLRGEKKRSQYYGNHLMHIDTRKQPDRNELIHVFKDHVSPYLKFEDAAFTDEQRKRIARLGITL